MAITRISRSRGKQATYVVRQKMKKIIRVSLQCSDDSFEEHGTWYMERFIHGTSVMSPVAQMYGVAYSYVFI